MAGPNRLQKQIRDSSLSDDRHEQLCFYSILLIVVIF